MQNLPEIADEMFCFAIYRATHAINRAYAPLLRQVGLTYPQYITLTLLWEKDGQLVGEIAKQMRMESSTVTPLLKRLEAMQHITRKRSVNDERRVHVYLTESGQALQAHAKEITACIVKSTDMVPEKLDELRQDLRMLTRNIDPG